MNKSKFSLDLLGVGCPNMRTFEILNTNSLILREYSDLVWPFPEQFSEETIFKNGKEYIDKVNKLLQNNELYMKCLINQQDIVKKYFNITWIRNYISSHMD
jgi:spore maturation protein CgeB